MGRIRSIKPEFPQSQSVGNLTREARLLFLQLFTVVDDSGRARGNSRMLASLLYPYDNDVHELIDRWFQELEQQGMAVRYTVDGNEYLQLTNWAKHQKVDKPSASKIPEFVEGSRIVANPREPSGTDQGSRIKEGIKDQGDVASPPATEPPAPAPAPPPAKASKPRGFDAAAIELPAWLDRDTWLLWCADRKKRSKPITEAAAQLQLVRLDEYRRQGFKPEAVIEHSIAGGYQGLFPPRGAAAPGVVVPDPRADRIAGLRGRRAPPPDPDVIDMEP